MEMCFTHLFPAVYSVSAEYRCAARGHPNTSECVTVHLILLDHTLTLFMLPSHKQKLFIRSLVIINKVCFGCFISVVCTAHVMVLCAHHIDSSVLSVVDLVVPDDRAAVGPDLDAS